MGFRVYDAMVTRSHIMLALVFLFFSVNEANVAALPSISLKNCPTEYVLEDSSCVCVGGNISVSSSRLLWKDPSGNTVAFGGESQTSLSLPFSAVKPQFNGMVYTCELADGGRPIAITYTPKVAQPPSQPVLNDCPTDFILPSDDTANCTCTTSNIGIPAAVLVWEDPEQNAVTFTHGQTSLALPFSAIKANFSRHTYHCVARHITGDQTVPYTPFLVVKPKVPEIKELKENYALGEMVQLICTVGGGVPDTQQIFFSCADHPDRPDRIEGSQLTSHLLFQAKTTDNNTQCDCYGSNDFFTSSVVSVVLHVGMAGDPDAQPRISLEDCPRYLVSNTSTSSCTCVAENLGDSSSTLLWKDPDGQTNTYTRTSDGSAELSLGKVDARFNKKQYQCSLLHSSGSQKISYTLQIAEPPSQPYLVGCSENDGRSYDTRSDCTCVTSNLGEPAALFVWYDPDQNPVAFIRSKTSLALPSSALKQSHRAQAYHCHLRHITGDLVVAYTVPPKPIEPQDDDVGLSGGAIAGIVIAVIFVSVVIIGVAIWWYRRRSYR